MHLYFREAGGKIILSLTILGKEDSEDWLKANVDFEQTGFKAEFVFSMMKNDFNPFSEELKVINETLNGEATFSTIEDNVQINITTDGIGHLKISGYLRHPNSWNLILNFEFESDQTFLKGMLQEIENIISAN